MIKSCNIFLVAVVASGCAGKPTPIDGPRAAFTYVEHQVDRGGHMRTLQSLNGPVQGVDIASRISIQVNEERLAAVMRPPELQAVVDRRVELQQRLTSLNRALGSIQGVIDASERAAARYQEARRQKDIEVARAAFAERNALTTTLIQTVGSAINNRLATQETPPPDPEAVARQLIRTSMNHPSVDSEFNWDSLATLIRSELAHATQAMERLPAGPRLSLELRAYHMGSAGTPRAAPLAGYNDLQPGPVAVTPKVQFSASPEEVALHREYERAIAEASTISGAGAAVMEGLRIEHQRVGVDLAKLVQQASATWTEIGALRGALVSWGERSTWSTITGDVAVQSTAGEAGDRLRERLDRAQELAKESTIEPALKLLETYAQLPDTFASSSPEEAMRTLLTTFSQSRDVVTSELFVPYRWQAWVEVAEDLRASLQEVNGTAAGAALTTSPAASLQRIDEIVAGLEAVHRLARTANRAAVAWTQRVIHSGPARAFSNFPIPEGQKRLPLGGNLDTNLDLRTLPFERAEHDLIRVRYRVFEADAPIASWDDDFEIRSFGLNARTIASLAMTTTDLDGAWRPTASFNWMVRYNGWPESYRRGLRYPIWSLFSVGISTMAMDDDPSQAVELGLGATAGLFDSRLMGGYGINLQSGNSGFWFFSLRLFSTGGGIGPIGD